MEIKVRSKNEAGIKKIKEKKKQELVNDIFFQLFLIKNFTFHFHEQKK
jgi:hypothetical protein